MTCLAPQDQFLPLIPMRARVGGIDEYRLVFASCKSCAENARPPPCVCPEHEREFITHLTSVEAEKALELGYRLDVHSVLDYPNSVRGLDIWIYQKSFLILEYGPVQAFHLQTDVAESCCEWMALGNGG